MARVVTKEIEMKNIRTVRLAMGLMGLGFVLLILLGLAFVFRENLFDFSQKVNAEKLSQYGTVM
jgi:hypothetical protein